MWTIMGQVLTGIFLRKVGGTEVGQTEMRPRWALIPVAMVVLAMGGTALFIRLTA